VIEQARKSSGERRQRAEDSARAYEAFLPRIAAPIFRQMAAALTAEGYPFTVHSPQGGLRLASERSPNDFIEIELDVSSDPPVVLGRASRGRGSRVIRTERPVGAITDIDQLSEEDVLRFLLEELAPLIER
jgi:hypothetical protein